VLESLVDQFSDHIFWDCDRASVDPKKHAGWLVARVLMRGKRSDWNRLKEVYGYDRIRDIATKVPYLDKRTLGFCSTYFQLPKSSFRCFTKNKLSSPAPFNS